MKKWKRKSWIILLVFVLGLTTGVCISSAYRKNTANPGNAPVLPPDTESAMDTVLADDTESANDTEFGVNTESAMDTVEIPDTEIPTGTLGIQDTYPQWDKGTTYVGGDKAVYNGTIYRAKWWTLGEIPGQTDVWEDTKETPPQPASDRETGTAGNSDGNASGNAGQENTGNGKTVPGTEKPAGLKVVGYYPDWKGCQPEKLQFDILTHVVYAFAIPTREGGVRPLSNPDVAVRLIQDAHKNQVKVLLAVGGWSDNGSELEPVFVSATQGSEKTRRFADQILAMCEEYGFDGVDIDWEHPRRDGSSKDQYEELILYLADQLHGKGKLLTSAVMGGVSADGIVSYDAAAHSDAVLAAVDWIHVMAYDGGDGERHSSYDFAENCASYWRTTRKMPKEKVVLGVPFYGRPGWAAYEDILKADPEAWKKDHTYVNGMDAYYNGVDTIERKTRYAKDNLGGIMIWEVTQDTADRSKSLLSAIGRGVR